MGGWATGCELLMFKSQHYGVSASLEISHAFGGSATASGPLAGASKPAEE